MIPYHLTEHDLRRAIGDDTCRLMAAPVGQVVTLSERKKM